jgi:hypothetical protein
MFECWPPSAVLLTECAPARRVVAPIPVSAFDPGATKVLEGELDRAVPRPPLSEITPLATTLWPRFSRGFLLP